MGEPIDDFKPDQPDPFLNSWYWRWVVPVRPLSNGTLPPLQTGSYSNLAL